MSTVAMARMTVQHGDNAFRSVQDDSIVDAPSGQPAANIPEKDPENNNGVTRKSDSGVYFAMMLSEYLDKNANDNALDSIQESPDANKDSTASPQPPPEDEAMTNLSSLIWVPAHKHPQIAPSEFANWIEVHGAAAPARKGSKVKRQKSQLSRSVSYNDDDDDTSDIQEQQDEEDTGRVLTPPAQKSLLRRSAFSARRAPNEGKWADRRRSRRPAPVPRHSTDTSERMGFVPSTEPIHLHDTPVSMSEWIDLGSASLEPGNHTILSRVHDAESHLFSKIIHPPNTANNDNDDNSMSDVTDKVVTLRRSSSDLTLSKVNRKPSSWISHFLNNDKKKKKSLRVVRRVDDARHISDKEKETLQLTRVSSMGHHAKKRGLAAFISRSLSLKSIGRKEHKLEEQQQQQTRPDLPSQQPDSVHSNMTMVKQSINSYRLPIHIERALYRLSHMKLASQRRPLHQQVVISNFMFWYLSIINPQPMNNNDQSNTPWPHHQEANEAAAIKNRRSPKFGAVGARRFSDDSMASRRSSQSSSDEEDNVPLSHYRK